MNPFHDRLVSSFPSLTAIRVFEAAARHENFTRAADELGLTQSAVSHQVRMLEERLAMPLFTRRNGRVVLTDAGRRLAPQVTTAFESLNEAFANLAQEDSKLLAISAASTFGTVWLAPRLGQFQIRNQDLGVRLSAEPRLIDFSTGEFDLAIRIGEGGGWAGLRQHFLFRVHYTPVCSPEFLARHQLRRPEQLLEVPRLSASAKWWRDWLLEASVTLPDEPESSLTLDHQTLEANAALAGTGVAMLTPFIWRTELASGRLVRPFEHVVQSTKSYWLVYPDAKRMRPKVRAFRDWLIEQIRAEAGTEPPEVFERNGLSPGDSPITPTPM